MIAHVNYEAVPDSEIGERLHRLAAAIRCFDRNDGRGFALPTVDPHGRPLDALSDVDLADVATWCMLDEFHEAVRLERRRRTLEGLAALGRAVGLGAYGAAATGRY